MTIPLHRTTWRPPSPRTLPTYLREGRGSMGHLRRGPVVCPISMPIHASGQENGLEPVGAVDKLFERLLAFGER